MYFRRASTIFFDFESTTMGELVAPVQDALTLVELKLDENQRSLNHCENTVQSDSALQEIIDMKIR